MHPILRDTPAVRATCISVLIASAVLICSAAVPGVGVEVATIAELRSRSGTNNGEIARVAGYHQAGDRGGGAFVWQEGDGNADDGGRFIVPTGAARGRWVRMLGGEVANVRMWGARGDGKANDTEAVQKAVKGCVYGYGWTMELLFPSGTYLLTNTIIFQGQLHIRGEGQADNTMIRMVGEHDVFRTALADRYLAGKREIGWDHWFIFENLYISCEETCRSNAALVVCNPGEGSVIRNLVTVGGGYGIRCFGVGAPGLRVMHTSIFQTFVANICIDGYLPDGTWMGGGDTVTLIDVSGDHGRVDSNSTACFLRVNKCWPTVSVYDFKAEGQFGGGLFRYDWQADASARPSLYNSIMGSLRIYGGTYNCGAATNHPQVDCDFVVLNSSGSWTPAVYILQPTMNGVRNLIRDDAAHRTVPCSASFTQARLPISYESFTSLENRAPRSRLVIGDSAIYHFVPRATGWYRVMTGLVRRMGGRLVINSYNESTDLDVYVAPGVGSGGAAINVSRKSIAQPWDSWKPRITQARAGSYFDPSPDVNGPRAFLDIYVERLPERGEAIVLAHPLEGETEVWTGVGATELLTPTAPVKDILPTGATVLYTCVTNSLTK